MEKMEVKNFMNPDEVRTFDLGKVELVKIGGRTIGRATLQPGWKWSLSVGPIVKTKSCEAPHFQYHVSGTMRVLMDDGTERDLNRVTYRYCRWDMSLGHWKESCSCS